MSVDHKVDATAPLQTKCAAIIESLLSKDIGVLAVVVGTADGRAVAYGSLPEQRVEPSRIAAIASSTLALSESFCRETVRDKTQYSSIVTGQGSIIIVRVPARKYPLVLCLWADNTHNWGMILHYALDCASKIAVAIDAH